MSEFVITSLPRDIIIEIGCAIPNWISFIAFMSSCRSIRSILHPLQEFVFKHMLYTVTDMNTKLLTSSLIIGFRSMIHERYVYMYQVLPLTESQIVRHGSYYKWKLINGIDETNFTSFKPISQGIYNGGERDGEWISYYPLFLGTNMRQPIKSIKRYSKDKINGIVITWHDNGLVRSKTVYKNGNIHGLMLVWNVDGTFNTGSYFIYGVFQYSCDEDGAFIPLSNDDSDMYIESDGYQDEDYTECHSIDYPDNDDEECGSDRYQVDEYDSGYESANSDISLY